MKKITLLFILFCTTFTKVSFAQSCASQSYAAITNPPLSWQQSYSNSTCGTTTTMCTGQIVSGRIFIDGNDPNVVNHDFCIDNLDICNPDGHCIELINCHNVTITHCYLHDAYAAAIKLTNCHNITINENRIQDADFGIHASAYPIFTLLGASNSFGIKITNNEIKNIWSRTGGGHAVIFNGVTTPEHGVVSEIQSVVKYNKFENVPFMSDPEDIINMYQSAGTADNPICVG